MSTSTTATDWVPVATTYHKSTRPPVSYHVTFANIRFHSSNIGANLVKAFETFFPPDELEKLAQVGFKGLDRTAMTFTKLEFSESQKSLRICFAKHKSDGSEEYPISFHRAYHMPDQVPDGPFKCKSHLTFVLGSALMGLATTLESERIAFAGKDGLPTSFPDFSLSQDSEMIVITAPLVGMTEDSYRKQFKLAKKKPKKSS